MLRITECRVNHLVNPVGYKMDNPVFSWITEGGTAKDSRIVVSTEKGVARDTGFREMNPLGTEVELTLSPRTEYKWKVFVRGLDGEVSESESWFFETGKRQEVWKGKWIAAAREDVRLPIFQKEVLIDKTKRLKKARLYICGLGLYEAYLDGVKIGDAYLTPGLFAYDKWIQVQTYPVTELLQSGRERQILSVLVGEGWYGGRFCFGSSRKSFYGKDMRLLAELHLEYEDGSEEIIGTDETWKVLRSKITFSGIYDGECRDDTLKEPLPETVVLAEPQKVPLTDNLSVPVKKQECFQAKIADTVSGELVLDIGQNIAGMFLLRVKEPAGKKVRLQFGEILQDGCFYRENLRTAKAEYCYISDGKEHVLRPHFTYFGYRYVKIEGVSNFSPEDFQAYAIYSDIPMRGTIHTGNKKINQLLSNVLWGMKSNFVDIPTDCPQRDERMGWTGDAQIFSETACFLADAYAFYRKYLYDMAQEQKECGGMVPDVIPSVGMRQSCSVWGDAACIIPWNLYLYYGDITILKEHYESMKAWLSYIEKTDGDNHGWRKVFHYGDWLALDSPYPGQYQTRGGTDEGFIAEVYYRKSALITAQTAELLGFDKDRIYYENLAERILSDIREEYFSTTGRCCINTQTAALLTLEENLNIPDRAREQLGTLIRNHNGKLTTGFVGTPLLCQCLTEQGMEKEAFRLLLNEEYPGWLYAVNLGATTVWERWDSVNETGHISEMGMNSLNHYAYGSVAAWIWKGIVGIKPVKEAPGFKKVIISPHVNWKVKSVNAVFPSPSGVYRIQWEIEDVSHIHIKIAVPSGCSATVILPYAKGREPFTLEGEYFEETYETESALWRGLNIEEDLRSLMSYPESREILESEIKDVKYLLTYTGDYPLRETLENLGYEKETIGRIAGRLQEIVI